MASTRKRKSTKKTVSRQRFPSRMDAPEGKTLTVHEALFVNYFLGEAKGKGSDAARMCGFHHPKEAAYKLLHRPNVRAAIKARLNKAAMSTEELLARLTEQASSSIEDVMSRYGNGWRVDLNKAKLRGKMHLIKKVTPTAHGLSVEMYSSESAREQLMRYHGLFQTNVNITHSLKVDMNALAGTREGLELLRRFAAGELDPESFYASSRSILEHNPSPSPVLIDGRDLVHEVQDPGDGDGPESS